MPTTSDQAVKRKNYFGWWTVMLQANRQSVLHRAPLAKVSVLKRFSVVDRLCATYHRFHIPFDIVLSSLMIVRFLTSKIEVRCGQRRNPIYSFPFASYTSENRRLRSIGQWALICVLRHFWSICVSSTVTYKHSSLSFRGVLIGFTNSLFLLYAGHFANVTERYPFFRHILVVDTAYRKVII